MAERARQTSSKSDGREFMELLAALTPVLLQLQGAGEAALKALREAAGIVADQGAKRAGSSEALASLEAFVGALLDRDDSARLAQMREQARGEALADIAAAIDAEVQTLPEGDARRAVLEDVLRGIRRQIPEDSIDFAKQAGPYDAGPWTGAADVERDKRARRGFHRVEVREDGKVSRKRR